MQSRDLTVRVLGDSTSVERAFTRSSRAATKFNRDMGRRVSAGDHLAPLLESTRKMQTETDVLSTRIAAVGTSADRAGTGLGAMAARAGLAGVAISAAYQGSRRLADALEQTGASAFTAEGRLRNFGAALLGGDIVGGIESLRAIPKTLGEAGISALEAANGYETFKRLVSAGDSPFAGLAKQAVHLVDATRAATAAQDALADSIARVGTAFVTSTGQAVNFRGAVDDAGGARGPGGIAQSNIAVDALRAALSGRIARPIGPTAKNAAAQIIAQASGNLTELLRLQEKERDSLAKAIENSRGNVEQREALNHQLAVAKGAVLGTEHQIKENAAAGQKAGAAAVEAARRNALALRERNRQIAQAAKEAAAQARTDMFAKFVGNLELGLDRAGLTRKLSDDLGALEALRDGLRGQVARGGDVADLQSNLVSVLGRIAETRDEIQQRAKSARSASLFKLLGLDASGGDLPPTVRALRAQVDAFAKAVEGTPLDTSKTEGQLARFRKVLTAALVPPDVRAKFKSMLDDLTGQLDDQAKGPLTKTSALNSSKILDGLGLSRDLEKQLRARLSNFNSAGVAIAPRGGSFSTGGGGFGGGAIVVENHNIIQLDEDVVGRSVTRSQQKTVRRNPRQKRGPNRNV